MSRNPTTATFTDPTCGETCILVVPEDGRAYPSAGEPEPVPAPPGTVDELSDVELAALDVVMAEHGYHRIAGGDMSKARENSPSPEPPTNLGNPEVEL